MFLLHPVVFHIFLDVQVFQGPGFLWSRFFWVRVQGLGPGFRSSLRAGRSLSFDTLKPFLKPGVILAFFRIYGKTPLSTHSLKKSQT